MLLVNQFTLGSKILRLVNPEKAPGESGNLVFVFSGVLFMKRSNVDFMPIFCTSFAGLEHNDFFCGTGF